MALRFRLYKLQLVLRDNLLITRYFIVLQQEDGSFRFTDFHRYIFPLSNKIRKVTDDGYSRFTFIIQFLNYIYFSRQIKSLNMLTVDIVKEFLTNYGMCSLPTDDDLKKRSESTVRRCSQYVFDFLQNLINDQQNLCRLRTNDLYTYVEKRDKRGRIHNVKTPVFSVKYIGHEHKIFRDIPNKAFDILFNHIALYHTELLGLVMLSSFAGLRPGEACNVRRADSPLGPGIRFTTIDGIVEKIEIDLSAEVNLRSDARSVGKIKKERTQVVPDIFLSAFKKSYDLYLEYLSKQKSESHYGPFTVNKQGKAMTYESYLKAFNYIVKNELIPIFLQDTDYEVVVFGRTLMEHNIGPHIFRHWYTVQLVLSGVTDVATLMYYRGDKSPESALTYLENKGELEKLYRKVNNDIFDYLLWNTEKERYND